MFRESGCDCFWSSELGLGVAYWISICTDGNDASNGIGAIRMEQRQTRATAGLIGAWASSAMILG